MHYTDKLKRPSGFIFLSVFFRRVNQFIVSITYYDKLVPTGNKCPVNYISHDWEAFFRQKS